jgi:diamine N-acetyltransferase
VNETTLKNLNPAITICPVASENWRGVANLKVTEPQLNYVAESCYYLALCQYGCNWHPLAICLGSQVIGFMMWAVDPADGCCWLGGITIDQNWQRRGYGRMAVEIAMDMLNREHGCVDFALSYQPGNVAARDLYTKIGFVETDEWEDDEVVARLSRNN